MGTSANTGASFTHTWVSGGTYVLEVTVSDGLGGISRQTVPVLVRDPLQTFSAVVSGGTADLSGVASSGTLLVAVGERGEIRCSVDGSLWSSRSIANAPNLNFEAVGWGGGCFVAVGGDYSQQSRAWFGVVYASRDGEVWTKVHSVPPSNEVFGSILRAVAYGDGRWVATGYGGTVVASEDGTNWNAETLPSLTPQDVVSGVAFGAGKFVAVGHVFSSDEQSGTPRVWTRFGAGWSLQALSGSGLSSWQDFRRISFVSDRWIAGGFHSKLRISRDGGVSFSSTRSEEEEMRFAVFSDEAFFVLASDGYVNSGAAVNPLPVGVVSFDGKNWSRLELSEELKAARAGTVFGGRVYAVGDGGRVWRTDSPLRMLRHPVSQTVSQFQSATFSALAAGSGALSYQWYWGDIPLPGETGMVLTVRGVNADVAGDYWVMVSDESGKAVPSLRATLSLGEPAGVNLVRGLESVGVVEGGGVVLRVECSFSSSPVTFVWRRNGIRLPPGGGDTLTLRGVGLEDEGWYEVRVVVGEAGSTQTLSSEAYVHVYPNGGSALRRRPFITRQPEGVVLMAGGLAELSAEAVDVPETSSGLSYQWLRDGRKLDGQTAPTLRIPHVKESDSGTYHVRISGEEGSVVSAPATVTVLGTRVASGAFFENPMPSGSRWIGEPFQIKPALVSGAVSFQWYRNGIALSGGTGAVLNVPPARMGAWDRFQLWVAGPDGAGTLSEASGLDTFDYSGWKGTFEGALRDVEGGIHGRATVTVSSGGVVSGAFFWQTMVHRFVGALGPGGEIAGDLRGWPLSIARYSVAMDWENGTVTVELGRAGGELHAAAACERAMVKRSNGLANLPFERPFSAECVVGSGSGVLQNYQGPLCVGGGRVERLGTAWIWGRMADGGMWTSASRWLIPGKAVCFGRVMNRPGPSAGWVGGMLAILPDSAEASLLEWTRPATAAAAIWKTGFSVRLEPVFSDYSPAALGGASPWASALGLNLVTRSPEGAEVTVPIDWSPATVALDAIPTEGAFAPLRLRLDKARGVVEGFSGEAGALGRYRWTGLLMQSGPGISPLIRGFVRRGEWIAPFECRPQTAPEAVRGAGK
jgi:hypothetical protein